MMLIELLTFVLNLVELWLQLQDFLQHLAFATPAVDFVLHLPSYFKALKEYLVAVAAWFCRDQETGICLLQLKGEIESLTNRMRSLEEEALARKTFHSQRRSRRSRSPSQYELWP
jgi:hypothetical protein